MTEIDETDFRSGFYPGCRMSALQMLHCSADASRLRPQ